jgi:site-specific DNA recombinase
MSALPIEPPAPIRPSLLSLYNREASSLDGLFFRPDWSGLRVAIYSRISEADDAAGVTRQDAGMYELATSRGATVVGHFTDNDISASRFSVKARPEFDAMIALVEAGEIDVILSYDLDRLWRRRMEFAWLCEFVAKHKDHLAVVTLAGDYDLSSPDGRFKAGIMVEVATMESEKTSRRQRLNNADLAQRGVRRKGRRTFGWNEDGKENAAEAAILRKAWRDVLAGVSVRQISMEWEERGVRPAYDLDRDGNPKPPVPWSKRGATIAQMLTNPRHVGDAMYRGEVAHPDAYDSLIDRETFALVVAALDARSLRGRGIVPGPRRRTPYTGLIFCGRCGEQLGRGKSGGRPVWRCHGCNVSVMADPVEALIDRYADRVVDDPTFRSALVGEVDDDGAWAEMDALMKHIDDTDEMWNTRRMSKDSYAKNMRTLQAERKELSARIARQERAHGLGTWMSEAGSVAGRLQDLPDELLRFFLHAVVARVTVHPATTRGRTFDTDRVEIDPTEAASVALSTRAQETS